MSHRLLSIRWACLALAALLAGPLFLPPAAGAQPSGVSLTLLKQPPWHEAGDDLGLTLQIQNHSDRALKGFAFRLFAYDRVANRTALEESFEQRPSALIGGEDRFFLERTVRPGSERTVRLSLPLEALGFSEDDPSGVYPVEVSLEGIPPETPLDSIITQVIFYPHSPETRLNLVPVVPLSSLPARNPDGRFVTDPVTGELPLEQAVAPHGWLRDLLVELEKHRGLHVGLAPTPRLIEELADMRNGYVREEGDRRTEVQAGAGGAADAGEVLAMLRSLLQKRRIQALLVPYAAPDLPTTASGSTHLLRQRQWKEGADVLSDIVGISPQDSGGSWLYPPGGRLDSAALEILQRDQAVGGSALRTFFSPGSVEPADPSTAGCPRALVTFACPLRVKTGEGPAQGFLADGILQKRFAALERDPDDAGLLLQRLLAETATIREEFPGLEARVIHVALPPLWHPGARLLHLLFRGMQAPWLRALTPEEGLRGAERFGSRRVVDRADPPQGAPEESYFTAVREASAAVESFSTIEPPGEALERLRRDVLVAQSRLWWVDAPLLNIGEAYASQAEEEARRYLERIQLGGRDSITLTSQRQDIPLVLFNENPFRVRVRVHLRSSSLDFIGGWEGGRQIPVPPGNQPLTIQATARQSGEFPLEVRLTTLDNALITQDVVRIRSTEFNKVALGITFGALAFLVLFYATRWLGRRRSEARTGSSGSTTA